MHLAYSVSSRPVSHLEFFLSRGVKNHPNASVHIDFFMSISGPCSFLACREPRTFVRDVHANLTVFSRPNIGFDFGSHADALQRVNWQEYDGFFFLNSGVTGPFLPHYMPPRFHWTDAFLNRLKGRVKMVGTTVVCLPPEDAGKKGPKVEGFAFALDRDGVDILLKSTAFQQHMTKEDAIVNGEYGASTAVFDAGFTMDCLLLAYKGRSWKKLDECNSMIHPSRRNSYFGTSINPIEVVFHKTFWAGQPPVAKEQVDELMSLEERVVETTGRIARKILVHLAYDEESSHRPSTHLEFLLRVAAQPHPSKDVRIDVVVSVRGRCSFEVCRQPGHFVLGSTEVMLRNVTGETRILSDHHGDAWNFASKDAADYDYWIFVSDEGVGPFFPAYMPEDWHWTDAFTQHKATDYVSSGGDVVVGTSSLLRRVRGDGKFCHSTNLFDCMFVKGFKTADFFSVAFETEEMTRYLKWNDYRNPAEFVPYEENGKTLCVVIKDFSEGGRLFQFVKSLKRMQYNLFRLRVNVCTRQTIPENVIDFPFLTKIKPPVLMDDQDAQLDYCIDQCLDDSTHLLVTDTSFSYAPTLLKEVYELNWISPFDVVGLSSFLHPGDTKSCTTYDLDQQNKELGFLIWNLKTFKTEHLRFHSLNRMVNTTTSSTDVLFNSIANVDHWKKLVLFNCFCWKN